MRKSGAPADARRLTTYSTLGHYQFTDLAVFDYNGVYSIQASFAATGLHQASGSAPSPCWSGSSAGYAVIVEGKVSTEDGLASHNKTANRIYETLKDRGFEDDNIIYFNYNDGIPGVDAEPDQDRDRVRDHHLGQRAG